MSSLFIGLMSGTSLDGVDGVVVDFDGADGSPASQSSPHATRATSPRRCAPSCWR